MARDGWVMWWVVLAYLFLLGAVSGVFMAFSIETGLYPITSMYLTVGILMYACNPRYWVYGFYDKYYPRPEIRMLLMWVMYYPYYFLLLLWIGYTRYCFDEE